MTEIHLTADTDVWTGASTTALLSARAAAAGIVLSAGNDDNVRRMQQGGVTVARCPMGGMFGALNLSRALRHIPGSAFKLYVHSLEAMRTVESALRLVGRPEPIELVAECPMPEFPKVTVAGPEADGEPLLMWLGNITDGCGLADVIEQLARYVDKPWRLRVTGQGKARIVAPLLKRVKALGIADRIEWTGYSSNPYVQMAGVSAGIVRNAGSVVAHEFAAASIPVFTNLSDIL